jgi:aminopeptidase
MLSKRYLDRYGEILLWGLKTARKHRFKKDDIVVIRYDAAAIPLAEVLYAGLLRMQVHPLLRMNRTAPMETDFFEGSNKSQLVFSPPGEKALYRHLNGSIHLLAPESLTHLSRVDPERIGRTAIANKVFRDILTRREESGDLGWTLCLYPTAALARHAGMGLTEYARQVVRACFLDRTDPVARWQEIFDRARAIKTRLDRLKVNSFRIESERVDLEITPGEKRKWAGISGRNIPSFEIFLSPDWRGTRGIYYSDQPSYRSGNYIEDVRLEFVKGRVVAASARRGETFLIKQLGMDAGAGRLGEFSLTDTRFSRIDRFMANTLYDENYGGKFGNCHVALGSSYANTFRGNPRELTKAVKRHLGFNASALHWDLVNTEKKRVVAHLKSGGRTTIYENGRFTL